MKQSLAGGYIMKIADFKIAVQENEGGGYIAQCNDIQGAFAEG